MPPFVSTQTKKVQSDQMEITLLILKMQIEDLCSLNLPQGSAGKGGGFSLCLVLLFKIIIPHSISILERKKDVSLPLKCLTA